MTKQYESEFISFMSNTEYPFVKLLGFPVSVILDMTLIYPEPLFMSSFISAPGQVTIVLSEVNSNPHIEAMVSTFPAYAGVYPFLSSEGIEDEITGYVKIGESVAAYASEFLEKSFEPEDSTLLDSVLCYKKSMTSINGKEGPDITLEAGYNMRIEVLDPSDPVLAEKVSEIKFVPSLGDGKGLYCGKETIPDGVFSINSVSPDVTGDLEISNDHLFRIDKEPGINTINLSLVVPENRLLCTRTGFKGPQGWPGPVGPEGPDGKDAPEVYIEYGYCNNPYRGHA